LGIGDERGESEEKWEKKSAEKSGEMR